ncbi:type II toxin-antitoxin system Phd/YefM family antitoxin [Streptomyces sp. NPDC002004]
MSITASEARKRLFPLIEQVNDDREPVVITSRNGNAVLMSEDDFNAWQETIYLLRSPANAQRLMGAVSDIRQGANLITKTEDDLGRLGHDSTETAGPA